MEKRSESSFNPFPQLISGSYYQVLVWSQVIIFSFSLFNCQVGSGSSLFQVYNDQCPNAHLAFLFNLQWIDLTSFDITVIQIGTDFSLTFTCEVRTYGQAEDLPPSCGNQRRRRRNVQSNLLPPKKGTFYTFNRKTRSFEI